MIAKVNRQELMGALTKLAMILPHESRSLPIISGVLLTVQDDVLRLSCTDLDVAGHVEIKLRTLLGGKAACTRLRPLLKAVRLMRDDEVRLDSESTPWFLVKGFDASKALLQFDAADYPALLTADGEDGFSLDAQVLRQYLHEGAVHARKEHRHSLLDGVFFENRGEDLHVCATDTHRLSHRIHKGINWSGERDFVMTRNAAYIAGRWIGKKASGEIRVCKANSQCELKWDNLRLVSRTLDGQFPNYDKVIPRECEYAATIHRESLLEAVRFVQDGAYAGKCALHFDDGKLYVRSFNSDLASQVVVRECVLEGMGEKPTFSIGFNAQYVLETISSFTGDKVLWQFQSPLRPTRIVDGGPGESLYECVIMPMELDGESDFKSGFARGFSFIEQV